MPVPYALLSHGKLLGETEFEYDTGTSHVRMGAFRPTPHGETVMPMLTGVQRAVRDLARKRRLAPSAAGDSDAPIRRGGDAEFADLAAAESLFSALELELRSPEGVTLPTEWIGVQDTEEMRRFAEDFREERLALETECDDELDASLAHDLELLDDEVDPDITESTWEADDDRGELPRYQILAEFTDPL